MKYEPKHKTYKEFHESSHDDSSIFCHLWAVRPQMQQKRVQASEIYKLFTGWGVMALPEQGDHRVFGSKYQLLQPGSFQKKTHHSSSVYLCSIITQSLQC